MKSNSTRVSRTQTVAFCGLLVALMVVSAWVVIPLGMIPVTLQVFVMVFTVLFLPLRHSLTAMGVYMLLGVAGLPVFSGMRGGIGVFAGPTGGFLWGFLAGALVVALILSVFEKNAPQKNLSQLIPGESGKLPTSYAKQIDRRHMIVSFVAAVAFLITMYLCGWLQLIFVTGMLPAEAFLTGVAPFIVIDLIKAIVAVFAVEAVKRALGN